ncbi:alpha-xenorhabdolysin family binary toxin subunit A [Pseudomonas sp. S37]|uniref:alpha-xenorhabdolysin family binary toxin subunit A n=1 Tax=Pseudomonas sp. S37 TaxID=2767449 RepID=UPI001913B02D|nr:alpha-xenorhabdolysin family binary toxin subunit A [Pseudomonas sp. S37]MBK4993371.1 alpha-xenorhabdolysin family binary toxin subunit A [Pseudomonas sp. S37]
MTVATDSEKYTVEEMDPVSKVKLLPERYFEFLESRLTSGQQAGSLLTAENLKAIKRYANVVNLLPRTLAQVEKEVDYAALNLDASLVYELYRALHRHVDEWDTLERSVKQLGPEIELFAESLVQRGSALLSHLENCDVFLAIQRSKAEQGDDVYLTPLSEDEQAQLKSVLTPGITELVREIENTRRRIDDVDARANWFNSEIRREIKPRLGRLLKHFDEKASSKAILEKRQQLDEWDEKIDQLATEYAANVGYAFTGLWFGPIGVAVTGGIFGSKAESIRAEKNTLIEQRDQLAQTVAKLMPALRDFERVSTLVRDLQFRCKDLTSASRRLADVWLFLASYAGNSVNEAKELKDINQLEAFVHDFSEVIKPWARIGSICHTLSELFDELVEEYEDA